jgi:hypothetical protein
MKHIKCAFFLLSADLFEILERRFVTKESYIQYSLHINTHMAEDTLKMFCNFGLSLNIWNCHTHLSETPT